MDTSKSIFSFVAWISSIFVYLCFIGWAFLPEETLHYIGITYYPSRYYAVALPSYLILLFILSGIGYIGYNLTITLEPENRETIRDKSSNVLQAPLIFIKCSAREGIPDIGDIDAVQISSVLTR